ncbi:TraX family protein [Senegalia sp. (in: firmicutes)]|uniref:TraX family protein n=1 Tax=Senegalia sp. (in: firmicutes) TaxID=1924098 RepID=UPI003F9C713B
MNVFVLKLIALITMIIDHYGAIFHHNEITFRIIGRIAFPIYAFLIVEGFIHTSDIKKYAKRLLIFAFLSEIPFDYAIFGEINFAHQNIFFELFIGIVALYYIEKKEILSQQISIIFIAGLISTLLMFDYNLLGIIYICTFYLTKDLSKNKRFSFVLVTIFISNLLISSSLQQYSLISILFLYLYNNEIGPKNKVIQFLFYLSYPLHLIIFAIMRFY